MCRAVVQKMCHGRGSGLCPPGLRGGKIIEGLEHRRIYSTSIKEELAHHLAECVGLCFCHRRGRVFFSPLYFGAISGGVSRVLAH